MDQEITRPETQPTPIASQAFGPMGCFLASSGATLLALCKLGAAMTATVWAASKLFGLPDIVMYALLVIGAVPVLWATVWTAGRVWHVEKRLAQGLDVDTPVFKLGRYFGHG